MPKKFKIYSFLAIITLTAFNNSIFAGSATTTMTVSAIVAASCVVSASALTFPNYSLTTDQTAITTITVTCTNTTPYTIGLDGGNAGASATTARVMKHGTNTLSYSLYRDSAHSQNWGIVTGVGGDVYSGTGTGTAQNITVYGKLPAQQPIAVSPGVYTDTINVIVSF